MLFDSKKELADIQLELQQKQGRLTRKDYQMCGTRGRGHDVGAMDTDLTSVCDKDIQRTRITKFIKSTDKTHPSFNQWIS